MPKFNKRKHSGGGWRGGGGQSRKRARGGSRGSLRGGARTDRAIGTGRASRPAALAPVASAVARLPPPDSEEEEEEPSALEEVLRLVGASGGRSDAVESDQSASESDAADSDATEGTESDQSASESDAADSDAAESAEEGNGSKGSDVSRDSGVSPLSGGGSEQRTSGGGRSGSEVGAEGDNDVEGDGDDVDCDGEEVEEDADPQETEDAATTPFSRHFEVLLPDAVAEQLLRGDGRWQQERLRWPTLGALSVQHWAADSSTAPLSAVDAVEQVRLYKSPVLRTEMDPVAYGIRQQIAGNVMDLNVSLFSERLTELQREVLSLIGDYRDLYFPGRTLQNHHQLTVAYCAHALSHVLRTRARIIHHNSKLSKKDDVPDSYRDQGLSRPKVLVVVPFRHSAYRIVNTLVQLLQPAGQSSVLRYERFVAEFGDGDAPPVPPPAHKPADFVATFTGNTDDAFRIGVQVTKKSLRLYSDFYHSDVIVTSPLGLRTVLGAEGEPDRDSDFLNSIEMLILDQTDVFLMQNWEHVLHLLQHLHLQPSDSHSVDFSRVRFWTLSGWQRLYRQTIVLSQLATPEINALVSKHCRNHAGRALVTAQQTVATIQQVVVQVPQTFQRFSASSLASEPDARFEYFVEHVLPQFRQPQMAHTLILVPSYFDYVRIRNHFIKETVNFAQICEYTKDGRVSRARDMFYHGKRNLLLYTERFHFFRRYRVKGIRHLLFYGLPIYPHLYSELCNLMQEVYQNRRTEQGGSSSASTVTVLFSKFDQLKMARVVGEQRANAIINADKSVHMFVTGES